MRQYRLKLGIAAYPRRGRPPGARDKQPRARRSQATLDKKPRRRLTISDEALARWHAQEYAWDKDRDRYVFGRRDEAGQISCARLGVPPSDLPRSLPGWGGGLGAPYLRWARPSWKGQDWDAIRRGGK
ncbi:MAG: hypothetical protein ACPLRW_10985 [Moorellales bacterium]